MVVCDVSLTPQFSTNVRLIGTVLLANHFGWLTMHSLSTQVLVTSFFVQDLGGCGAKHQPQHPRLIFIAPYPQVGSLDNGTKKFWRKFPYNVGQTPGKCVMRIGIGEVFDIYIWFGVGLYMFSPTTYGHEAPSNTKVNQTQKNPSQTVRRLFIWNMPVAANELRSRIFLYVYTPFHEILPWNHHCNNT